MNTEGCEPNAWVVFLIGFMTGVGATCVVIGLILQGTA